MKMYRVTWKTSTPEHPQSNGLVERFNRTIQVIMTKLLIEEDEEWDEILPYALQAYRGTYHETLRMSPFKATFGSEMTTIMSLQMPEDPNRIIEELRYSELTTTERVAHIRDLQEGLVQHLNEQQRLRESAQGDEAVQLLERYHVGDRVWLYHPSRPEMKFTASWTGPHEIIELRPPVNLIIREKMKNREEVHTVHVSRTKPYVNRAPRPQGFPEVLLWDESIDETTWDVTPEELRQHREEAFGDVREDNPEEAKEQGAIPDEEMVAGKSYEEVETIAGHKWSIENTEAEVSRGKKRPTKPRLWYHLKYKGFRVNPKDWYSAADIGRTCRDLIREYKGKFPNRKLPNEAGDLTGFEDA